MGTPVPLKSRENMCIGAEPAVKTRQLTEEERRYYNSLAKPKKKAVFILPEDENLYINQRKDDKEMPKRIDPPSKEDLATMCMKHPTRYRATVAIAESMGCSRCTVDRWILDSGLKGIWDKPVIAIQAEKEPCSGEPDQDTNEFNGVIKDNFGRFDNISEGINSETVEEFQLTNKMYRFGTLDIDIQYSLKRVVIVDSESGAETEIPFTKVKTFAKNLKAIGDELEGGKA